MTLRKSATDAIRRLPIPDAARQRAHATLPWRPGTRTVPTNRLLLGLQNRTPAAEFARFIGDLRWPSTPLADGPHAALLRLAEARGELSDEEILATPYVRMARQCIAVRGFYFWATDDVGIVEVARDYIARHRGESVGRTSEHSTAPGVPPRVAVIAGSDCYQVLDGHHRLASAIVAGQRSADVKVKWFPVNTLLQELLRNTTGANEVLAQPVDAPEVRSWATARWCVDRFDRMQGLLRSANLMPPATSTYLDVGSRYGWFLARMQEQGFTVTGVEKDPSAPAVSATAYRLDPAFVRVADAARLLREADAQWDVVSCFGPFSAVTAGDRPANQQVLVSLLAKVTRRVLFLDFGREQDERLVDACFGGNPRSIAGFLRQSTGFPEVVDLGPVADPLGSAKPGRGGHLFACVSSSP